jgi:hypothetical protein
MVKTKRKKVFKLPEAKPPSRKERLMKQVETDTTTSERNELSEWDAIEYNRKRPPPKLTKHEAIFD